MATETQQGGSALKELVDLRSGYNRLNDVGKNFNRSTNSELVWLITLQFVLDIVKHFDGLIAFGRLERSCLLKSFFNSVECF